MGKKQRDPKSFDHRVQEGMSKHQFAARILEYGWKTDPIEIDNGQDLQVEVLRRMPERNPLETTRAVFPVQLKSVTELENYVSKRRSHVQYSIAVKNLREWAYYLTPLVIVVWDIRKQEGRWIIANDVITQLDQSQPGWRERMPDQKVAIRIPWQNTTDDAGLTRLKHQMGHIFVRQALANRSLIGGRLKFSIPESDTEKRAEFQNHIAHGTYLTISDPYIVEIRWPEIVDDFFGDIKISQISIVPQASEVKRLLSIEIETNNHKSASFRNLEFATVEEGAETFTISNRHQSTSVHFTIRVSTPKFAAKYQGQSESLSQIFMFTIKNLGGNVCETFNNMVLFDLVKHGGILRLISHEQDNLEAEVPIEAGELPASFEPPTYAFFEFIENLCKIQKHTKIRLRLPKDDSLVTLDDYNAAKMIVELIEKGEFMEVVEEGTLSFELLPEFREAFMEDSLKMTEHGDPLMFFMQSAGFSIELLGKTIQLNDATIFYEGMPKLGPERYASLVRDHDYTKKLSLDLRPLRITTRLDKVLVRPTPPATIDLTK